MRRLALVAMTLALALAAAFFGPGSAFAQERVTLGWGRMFVNDGLGDFKDRWRTGSYLVSRVRGPEWSGSLPGKFGSLLEFRARAEVIAPANLTFQPLGDRRYAGILSFGIHTHFQTHGVETSLGMDMAITGPQTGLDDVQSAIHEALDYPKPLVASLQIPNHVYATFLAEFGRSLDLGGNARVRPFIQAQAGIETFARMGFDLSVGNFEQGALMIRDPVSGHRYRAVAGNLTPGFSYTIGADVAHVFDSALLPAGGAAQLSATRTRLRTGLAWQGEHAHVFYGLTWLGKEFEGQPENQLIGALSLKLYF